MAAQQQNARRLIPNLVISIFSFTKVIGVQQDSWTNDTITNNIVHEMVQHNTFSATADNVKPKGEAQEKEKAPEQQEIDRLVRRPAPPELDGREKRYWKRREKRRTEVLKREMEEERRKQGERPAIEAP